MVGFEGIVFIMGVQCLNSFKELIRLYVDDILKFHFLLSIILTGTPCLKLSRKAYNHWFNSKETRRVDGGARINIRSSQKCWREAPEYCPTGPIKTTLFTNFILRIHLPWWGLESPSCLDYVIGLSWLWTANWPKNNGYRVEWMPIIMWKCNLCIVCLDPLVACDIKFVF